jgi:PAS domain S-box-containing protein
MYVDILNNNGVCIKLVRHHTGINNSHSSYMGQLNRLPPHFKHNRELLRPEKTVGMLNPTYNFKKLYPDYWNKIMTNEPGIININSGYLVFNKIKNVSPKANIKYDSTFPWIMVQLITEEKVRPFFDSINRLFLNIFLVVEILLISIAFFAAKLWEKRAIMATQIKRQMKRSRDIVRLMPMGIYISDYKGNVSFINQRLKDILGFTINDFKEKDWISKISPSKEAEESILQRYKEDINNLKSGALITTLRRIILKDKFGKPHTIEVILSHFSDEEYIGVINDITSMIDIKNALNESEQERLSILDSISDGMFYVDNDCNVLWANKNIMSIYNVNDNISCIGQKCFSVFGCFEKECEGCLLKETLDTMTKKEIHVKRNNKNLQISYYPVKNDDDKPKGCIVQVRDETEKRIMEKQFSQAQKLQAIGLLAGGIAHDFNNYLSGILGFAQLLGKIETDASKADKLEMIIDCAKHCSDLTKQLLTFSRKGKLNKTVFDINSIILQMCSIFEGNNSNIKVERNLQGRELKIHGDREQIDNMLLNLSLNARDAMILKGGTVTFETKTIDITDTLSIPQEMTNMKLGSYVEIIVADTGEGMDESTKEHIFEPFFTTKPFGKGIGMGMANVYGVIKNHGGYIFVNTEVGKGTRFTIFLPYDPSIENNDNKPEANA